MLQLINTYHTLTHIIARRQDGAHDQQLDGVGSSTTTLDVAITHSQDGVHQQQLDGVNSSTTTTTGVVITSARRRVVDVGNRLGIAIHEGQKLHETVVDYRKRMRKEKQVVNKRKSEVDMVEGLYDQLQLLPSLQQLAQIHPGVDVKVAHRMYMAMRRWELRQWLMTVETCVSCSKTWLDDSDGMLQMKDGVLTRAYTAFKPAYVCDCHADLVHVTRPAGHHINVLSKLVCNECVLSDTETALCAYVWPEKRGVLRSATRTCSAS
jgi:hypothetical protein